MAWPRRVTLALIALALGAGLWRAAGQPRPDSPFTPESGPKFALLPLVEVELADGTKLAGSAGARFELVADYGRVSLDPMKVKTLDFAERDAGAPGRSVVATLVDKTTLAGSVPADQPFALTGADGAAQAIPAAKLERVTFLHPKDTSWTAVVLGLLTLTLMEIILGVDNVIFLAIQADKLPEAERPRARTIGLAVALGTRVCLLLTLSWMLGLTKPVFTLPQLPLLKTAEERGISWRDLILLVGGAYLIYQSVREMHEKLEASRAEGEPTAAGAARRVSFARVIGTIALMDILFSLDSVITAVGMVDDVPVMIAAMVLAMLVMLAFAAPIGRFVNDRPTVKVLALSFLILIGVLLVAEGLGQHVEKGYIYFAMAFAVGVELVNLQLRKKPVGVELAGTTR